MSLSSKITESEWLKALWPNAAHLIDRVLEERRAAESEIEKKLSAIAISHAGREDELEYQKVLWVMRRCKELGVDPIEAKTNGPFITY